jgi:L,D-transpeptidase catalytic domain
VIVSRRIFIGTAVAGMAGALSRPAAATESGAAPAAAIRQRALAVLEHHRTALVDREWIAIADFSLPSSAPRFHLLRPADGRLRTYLVAHGKGSDPEHTGWLERFSNEPHSNATSAGAYRTDEVYFGGHGRSLRLEGLDRSNSNAAARAIVVHGAWYVSDSMIGRCGMLGRSQGCFAVAHSNLDEILAVLRPGRLLYADKA